VGIFILLLQVRRQKRSNQGDSAGFWLAIQWIDTERNIDVCIYTFIPKLYPLRGPRNNDIYLPLRSWFLNTILQKRNQSSLKWVDSKIEAGKMKNEPEAFCGFRK